MTETLIQPFNGNHDEVDWYTAIDGPVPRSGIRRTLPKMDQLQEWGALFDQRGYWTLTKRDAMPGILLSCPCEPDTALALQRAFGGSISTRTPGDTPRFMASGTRAVQIIKAIFPYLDAQRDSAQIILDFAELQKNKPRPQDIVRWERFVDRYQELFVTIRQINRARQRERFEAGVAQSKLVLPERVARELATIVDDQAFITITSTQTANRKTPRYQAVLRVIGPDKHQVMLNLQQYLGGAIVGTRPEYIISGQQLTAAINALLPYMREQREQAEIVLAVQLLHMNSVDYRDRTVQSTNYVAQSEELRQRMDRCNAVRRERYREIWEW